MKKIILTIIVVVVIIVVASALYFWLTGNIPAGTGGTGTTGSVLPTPATSSSPSGPIIAPTGNYASSTSFPTSTIFTIGTSRGSVTVNNFYKDASLITPDAQTVLIAATASYDIAYNVSDSSFSIALLMEPLSESRTQAETAFLAKLGITQANACKLTVTESVPASIDANYAGENFGLSFCPGAINL